MSEQKSRSGDFFLGLMSPLRAFGWFFRHPSAWIFVFIPVVIMGSLLCAALYFALPYTDGLVHAYWPTPTSTWPLVGWWITRVVVWIATAGLSAIASTAAASVLASPFNDRLGEKVEEAELGVVAPPISWGQLAVDLWRCAVHTLINLILVAIMLVPLVLLHLVPVIGSIVSAIGGFLVSGTFLALQFADLPMDRRRFSYAEKLSVMNRNRSTFAGLGVGLTLLLLLPVIDLMLVPIAGIAGTLLFLKLDADGLIHVADKRDLPELPSA